jgi:hypothetical protein
MSGARSARLALRCLQAQHHDGDGNGDDAIAEGFQARLVHGAALAGSGWRHSHTIATDQHRHDQPGEADEVIGEGGGDGADAEGQHRPHELDAALGGAGIGRAAQHVHHVDHHLRDVARHQRGRCQVRQQQAADGAVYAHGGGTQQAGSHHPAAVGDCTGVAAMPQSMNPISSTNCSSSDQPSARPLRRWMEAMNARHRHTEDEGREGQEFQEDGHLPAIGQGRADEDEVARHVRREQAKQGDEAQRVDIGGEKSQSEDWRRLRCAAFMRCLASEGRA